ncbi:zinc-finger homeodomain protein 6 [Benincasa hispida]|uniref:zinc-finger homeodomain protein 6 n=1 Tax=Benincasa hispida TaxID=102211 RepID=UPI0018FFDFBE|nr:zinc-finger homeodomain protein 6 [Benincasa hispida]XP_038882489.1 zinc-finger homeodomain protein 6 [Benincasa hispida]
MEMRGEEEEIGTPKSPLCYNNPSSNRESSTKQPNSDRPFLTTAADRRRDHTVPQLHFSHHHTLNLHHIHKQHTRDQHEATPDPPIQPSISASPPSAVTPPPIASGRLISRTPPFPSATDNGIPSSVIRYRECLKNHAASTGGHVLDGCGEFMPNGEDGTPEALKCAACECHRNFHRKEMKEEVPLQHALPSGFFISNPVRNNGHRTDRTPVVSVPRHHQLPAVPISSMMMAFGGGSNGALDESSSEDLNMYHPSNNGARDLFGQQTQLIKKRFRTKFTQGQKDKMVEFAEKLGWKIQKHDELEVQQFCAEVGVRRQVFKVWMHNNKQAMKKKQM